MKASKLAAISLGAIFTAAASHAPAHAGDALSFYNTHTGESVTADPSTAAGRKAINGILRDHRRNEVRAINPALLTLLGRIEDRIEARHPGLHVVFHIISGYRAPQTNESLRKAGGGQAKKSQHMHGNAIDIRVPGVSTRELRDIAWCLQKGGVGYYKGSAFVHVDTARVRFWNWAPKAGMCK